MMDNMSRTENAERAVLGSMMKSPEAIRQAKDALQETDFTVRNHGELFSVIVRMYDEGVVAEIATIESRLKNPEQLILIIDCMKDTLSAANVDAYIRIVREAAERRRTVQIANRLEERIAGGDDLQATIATAREDLANVHTIRNDWRDGGDVMVDAYGYIEDCAKKRIVPCVSGIDGLDRLTGGFFPGELTILAARPSVGKSALGLFIAVSTSMKEKPVAFVSGEMTAEQIGARLIVQASNVNGMKLRSTEHLVDDDWQKMTDGMLQYGELPLKFLFKRNLDDIVSQARTLHEHGLIDMLIVDYIQILSTRQSFEADRLRIGHITKELKSLANELKIPVIALAQRTRPGDGHAGANKLDSLKGSGNMEEDADNVIVMDRIENESDPELNESNRPVFLSLRSKERELIVLSVVKQRQGRTGKVYVGFDPRQMMFFPV